MQSLLAWIDRRAAFLFAAFSVVAFLGLLYLGRGGSFFNDEWVFIRVDGLGTLQDWFAPNNEHWSTVPFGIYRPLLLTIGMKSYLPYLVVLLSIHVAASSALFILLRRASGSLVALLGSGLFLVLGNAHDDLFWAFQIGFVTSTAAGLWGLVALEYSRPRLAALLFLVSVASSAMGLPMLAVGAVELAMTRGRRRELGWLFAVAVMFVLWFSAIGSTGLASQSLSSVALTNLLHLPTFAASGLVGAVDAALGLGGVLGTIGIVAVIAAAVGLLARGELPSRAVSAAAGLATMYFLIGLGRAQFGDGQAYASRYLYEAVALLLIGFSAIIGRRADLLPGSSKAEPTSQAGQATVRGQRQVALGLLMVALVANGGIANVHGLFAGARWFRERAGELRGALALIDRYGDALPYDPPAEGPWFPDIGDLTVLPHRWGTPAVDVLLPSVVRPPTARERDRALWLLVGNATKPRPIATPSAAPTVGVIGGPRSGLPRDPGEPPITVAVTGAVSVPTGHCVVLQAAGQRSMSEMAVSLQMGDGTSVDVLTVGGGTGALRLGRDAPPVSNNQATVDFPDGSWVAIDVPRLGDGSVFTLQLLFPSGAGAAVVCTDQGGQPSAN